MISPKVPNWSPDSYTKAVSNIDSNSPRNSTTKVLTPMGHCDRFGYALWATAINLVIRYGPLRQISLYAMGHCDRFGNALWATAINLVIRYGPLRQIW